MTTIITLHGLVEDSTDYAKKLFDNLPKEFTKISLYWEDLMDVPADQILAIDYTTEAWKKFHLKGIREVVNQVMIDSFSWFNSSWRKKIKESLLSQLQTIPADEMKILVLHSWGTIIMIDLLLNNEIFAQEKLSIFTAGSPLLMCNIITNSLPKETPYPWQNFYHPGDVIASPLSEIKGVKDIKIIDAGGPDLGFDLSLPFVYINHTCYWGSKQFANAIIKEAMK